MAKRPTELIYALDERPPWLQLLGLGFQHVAGVPLSGDGGPRRERRETAGPRGRERHRSRHGRGRLHDRHPEVPRLGPVGSGYLCPPVVSAIYLPSSLAAAASFGISAVCGMTIFAGVCEIAIASLVNRTRKLFPAVVSGGRTMAVGLEIGKIAAGVLLEHVAARGDQAIGSFATAAFALAAMAGLAVWASGPPKLFCALMGLGRVRGGGRVPGVSAELLRGFRIRSHVRRPRPPIPLLWVRALPRLPFRDRGTRLGSPGDRRPDHLSANKRRRLASPRHAQHCRWHPRRRHRLPCRRSVGGPGDEREPQSRQRREDHRRDEPDYRLVNRLLARCAVVPAEVRGPHRQHAAPGDGSGVVLQRRSHAGRGDPDHRQPPDHPASLAHCRIVNPGGADRAGLCRLLPIPSRFVASVLWFDDLHGGGRGRAAQRTLPARDVALQSFASRGGCGARHGCLLRRLF